MRSLFLLSLFYYENDYESYICINFYCFAVVSIAVIEYDYFVGSEDMPFIMLPFFK